MTSEFLKPTLLRALIPILALILMLSTSVIVYGDEAIGGPNQLSLLLAAAVAGLVSLKLGYRWKEMQNGIVSSISNAMGAILILLLIGSLAGTWLISGIVPAMIYYGLKILNPTIFLFAACLVSAIVSLATGSSWSTIATLGVALLGIGKALGLADGVIAGAIISGAYFGDKMSPLSDTTNLAPAMAGTDLFTHIRYMTHTTVPSILLTLIIFLVMGFSIDTSGSIGDIPLILSSIEGAFNITGWLFLVPAVVIFLIIKKVPAVPALLVGTLMGGLFAVIFQPQILDQVSGISGNFLKSSFMAVFNAMYATVNVTTNHEMVNNLLSTGGMSGMLNTIWLIMCAMTFGGIMEVTGMLNVIASQVVKFATSTGNLIAATAVTCGFFNVTASDQYLAIVVPGRMFAGTYKGRGLKPEVLSRTLEDSGTVTSVLVPWNTCGATQSSVLGVATGTYLPYCFFNIISPLMTVLFGYLNIKIRRFEEPEKGN